MGADESRCCAAPAKPNMVTVTANPGNSTEEAENIGRITQMKMKAAEEEDISRKIKHMKVAGQEEKTRELIKMKVRGQRKARMTVPIMSHTRLSDYVPPNYVKPVYQKDEYTRQRIQRFVQDSARLQVIFGHLDDEALNDVVNAFQEVRTEDGQEIVRQGDAGDCLYVVGFGQVGVFVARTDSDGEADRRNRGKCITNLGPGALFGDHSLMYFTPRAATVVSTIASTLFQLDKQPFELLRAQQHQKQHETYMAWLSKVEVLKSLKHCELTQLCGLLESTLYVAGEDIVVQGEFCHKFHILEDGSCGAFIDGRGGGKKVKEYKKPGDHFGEVALIIDEPKNTKTIRAIGTGARILSISKKDLTTVVGPIRRKSKQKDLDEIPQNASVLGA